MRTSGPRPPRTEAADDAAAAWPRVEAVVLSYNDRDRLEVCLEALAKLDYPSLGITVVDNGSTEKPAELVRGACPAAAVIGLPRNVGYAAGNNAALGTRRCAESEYVWLLNSDSRPEPGALTALVRVAESEPGLGAVGSLLLEADGSGAVQAMGGYVGLVTGLSRHLRDHRGARALSYLVGASLLLRRRALDEAGHFDERFFLYWEDADLCFRLRRCGWGLAVAPDSLVTHVGPGAAVPSPEWDRRFSESSFAFFRRHARVPAVPIVLGSVLRAAIRCRAGRWRNAGAIARAHAAELGRRRAGGGQSDAR